MPRGCQRWFVEVSCATSFGRIPEYLEIKYEDLATEPERIPTSVRRHLGVSYEGKMLDGAPNRYRESLSKELHESWTATPGAAAISNRTVGQFEQRLSGRELRVFWSVRASSFARRQSRVHHAGTPELMVDLG